MSTDKPSSEAPARGCFLTTRWTVVLTAQRKDSPSADAALEQLCEAYWYPLYAYVRRLGHSAPDAQDLTQEFFARLLSKDYLAAVTRERGRFRNFLLSAFKRFLANEWDRARARKRGGGKLPLSLDAAAAESRYQIEPVDKLTADLIYDRRWALTLLDRTVDRLREEAVQTGKGEQFERLRGFLGEDKASIRYAETAQALGMSEGAVRVAIHRWRRRFRELFREQIADTVHDPAELEDEIRHLLSVLSG